MKKIIFIAVLILLSLIVAIYLNEDKKVSEYTVYTNSEYGFNFEYPKSWYLEDNPEFGTIFLSSKEEEAPMSGVTSGVRIETFIIENAENLGLEEWIEWNKFQGGPEEELLESKEITVGDKEAIQETVAVTPGPVEQGNPTAVYLSDNGNIIQMNYTGREPDYSQEIEIFQHLLGSFKFE